MALQHRPDTPGRTRFLLALTLSTVTAVGVAAPLAVQALRADEVRFAVQPDEPENSTPSTAEDRESIDRELRSDSDSKGGIGSRPPAKAVGQTTKSGSSAPRPAPAPADDTVLTNPTVEVDPGAGPSTTEPAAPDPETTVPAPDATDTTSGPTTETTADPDGSSSTTGSTTSTTTPSTATTATTTTTTGG